MGGSLSPQRPVLGPTTSPHKGTINASGPNAPPLTGGTNNSSGTPGAGPPPQPFNPFTKLPFIFRQPFYKPSGPGGGLMAPYNPTNFRYIKGPRIPANRFIRFNSPFGSPLLGNPLGDIIDIINGDVPNFVPGRDVIILTPFGFLIIMHDEPVEA